MVRGEYHISEKATNKLEGFVSDLEQNPRGKLVDPIDFGEFSSLFNRQDVINNLPPALSEEDFTGIMRLSMLTECATDTYVRVFVQSSRDYKAPWLGRFTEKIWAPDEYTHADPFKAILLNMGYEEQELDRQIKEAREVVYVHASGTTPFELAEFGEKQEDLTGGWYTLSRPILARISPQAGKHVGSIEKREVLHKVWYKDIVGIHIEDNPDFVKNIADTMDDFNMPSTQIAPDLQKQSPRWIAQMGGDFRQIERRLIRLTSASINDDAALMGKLMLELIPRKVEGLVALPFELARKVSDVPLLGDVVNILVGQIVHVREGIEKPKSAKEQIIWDLTTPIRTSVIKKLDTFSYKGT